jgi:hypothetical protein
MILTNENEIFLDYVIGPIFYGQEMSIKEIKGIEDHKKLKYHISFYEYNEVITKKTLSDFLRPIVSQMKTNGIWFSVRPTGFTNSVGHYVANNLSNKSGFTNYIFMTVQTRDYSLRTKKLILYHSLDNNIKNKVKEILDYDNIIDDNIITINL